MNAQSSTARSKVTIKDVAQQAGVSVGTVSRVLNGYANISQVNVSRVRQAIEQLGYRQCDSARMLAGRRSGSRSRTGNIGVFCSRMGSEWADHPLLVSYMTGVESACEEGGYHPLLEFSDGDESGLPRFLRDRKVDGLLVKGSALQPPPWLAAAAKELPMVGMRMAEPGLTIPQIMPDDRAAGWQMAEYLWKCGHRRIGFVSSDARHRSLLHRRQGIEEFLRMQGVEPKAMVICESLPELVLAASRPEASPPDMTQTLEQMWALPAEERPTAIVAANDWNAAGLYRALSERGLSVPEDVSVVGFDNALAVCCSLKPSLTSYAVPMRQMAYVATKLLLSRIESPKQYCMAGIQMIAGTIVERQSVRFAT